MKSGIYKIVHIDTGRAYVGSAVNLKSRWRTHRCELSKGRHHSRRLQYSWNAYGEAAFAFIVLEYVEREELIEREQFWIEALSAHPTGYNILPKAGSQMGRVVTDEARANMRASSQKWKPRSAEIRAKISAAQKGKPRNPESIAKMAATKKGMIIPAETRARMSAGQMGRKLSPEVIEKRSAKRRGMRHSEAAKARMSAAHKGRPLSPETCAKLSAALLGRPKSAETRMRMCQAQQARSLEQAQRVAGNGRAFEQATAQ